MPIEVTVASEPTQDFNEEALFTPKGVLTLESEVLAGFLSTLDFDPLFEHPDVRQFVETGPVRVLESDDSIVPLMEDEDGEEDADGVMVLEYLDGAIAAEFLDEADLAQMLEYYLKHEFPNETLEDRTALQQFADIVEDGTDEDEPLEEKFGRPFRKGDFRKGPMKNVSAKSKGVGRKAYGQRVRMMVAMLKKGAITRVPKGTGYKGGDYKRGPKYGGGTPAGKKAYAAASVKDARQAGKITKMVDPGRRNIVKLIYKNLGSNMPKNWIPPERRGKSLKAGKIVVKKVGVKTDTVPAVGKASKLFGKKPIGSKGKQVDVAHDASAVSNIHEGSRLAGAVIAAGNRHRAVLTETK